MILIDDQHIDDEHGECDVPIPCSHTTDVTVRM